MSSIPDIPQELVAKIVGELRDDLPSLRASALISRSFLPWSRLHLFFSVRLTPRNVYAFRTLVSPSSDVAMYIRRLDIPLINNDLPSSALLPPESLAQLPHITHLSAHGDPFGVRQLSDVQRALLGRGLHHVTTVHIRILNHVCALPEWARVLNGCSSLTELDIHAESNGHGWATWNADELQMPAVPTTEGQNLPRLHTVRIAGDCKVLGPLGRWLVPSGLLDTLHTLSIDVVYVRGDYDLPDQRPALVLAAASQLQELTLHLDPPMTLATGDSHPISLASFPHLRSLHFKDGEDANVSDSLAWLNQFLHLGLGALEHITIDHGMIQRDLLEVPATTWYALEEALLRSEDGGPRFLGLTFKGYNKFSFGSPDAFDRHAFDRFEALLRCYLPRVETAGMLRIVR
ncbi:hypothetical protein FB45DRAFT_1059917 [Roridomyces roridus]|uniref:Uncharacterized protein n=1 Tax=Roridomyces roridus TaxID=1738132 RepID=A0AAD7BPM5_9AGAR|nr:hypothetical protein FB45DRAFT_1059917 [Roridomyces roridus]